MYFLQANMASCRKTGFNWEGFDFFTVFICQHLAKSTDSLSGMYINFYSKYLTTAHLHHDALCNDSDEENDRFIQYLVWHLF